MNFDMQTFQDRVSRLVLAHEQKQELLKEKRRIEKEYQTAKNQIIEDLRRIKQTKLIVDAYNNKKYEIEIVPGKKTKGVKATERESYIDNMVLKQELDPEELAQSLKDLLQGDIEFVDKLTIKEVSK